MRAGGGEDEEAECCCLVLTMEGLVDMRWTGGGECVNMNVDRELDNDVCCDLSPDSGVSPPVTAALHSL